jgi:IS30 family transposase
MTTQAQEVRALINGLMDDGMSANQIAGKLDHRVSVRTIYRWAKGESVPQQSSDVAALKKLVEGQTEKE